MRIAVAMSGGIDSSVAALLLHQQGHQVLGLTMQVWVEEARACSPTRDNTCCGEPHVNDARRVAATVGFPHYALDFRDAFQRHVVRNFIEEYQAGRTPIPCVHCNKALKFDILLEQVRQLGCDSLATGHYIRKELDPETGRWRLLRSAERERDQSYFLFNLTQEQLGMLEFPVGTWEKARLRAFARDHGLPNHAKRDSYDICFVPGGDYREVLDATGEFPHQEGEIVDLHGRVLGRHGGVHRYTLGQRKGLGIAAAEPLYVVRLDPRRKQVVVGPHDALFSDTVQVRAVHWIAGTPPAEGTQVEARLRSAHPGAPALIETLSADGTQVRLRFPQPERAVTPGQAAVLYAGDDVLGGGWIVGG